jgi:hypothetical protein
MNKKERLKEMRMRHMRERAEIRDNEMYTREGEDMRIQQIRDNMAGVLANPNFNTDERKQKLAFMKTSIDEILDLRDEREHAFIEEELKNHQLEQELEQEIESEEKKSVPVNDELKIQLRARPFLAAGAEQMRKIIEEKRKELDEDEQFSTILINNSERDNIPSFVRTRRKNDEQSEQPARIDTIVIKQREIGLMYRESRELQESQLKKSAKKIETPEESETENDIESDEQDLQSFEETFQTMDLPNE